MGSIGNYPEAPGVGQVRPFVGYYQAERRLGCHQNGHDRDRLPIARWRDGSVPKYIAADDAICRQMTTH